MHSPTRKLNCLVFRKLRLTSHSKTALRAVFLVSLSSKVLIDSQILARKPGGTCTKTVPMGQAQPVPVGQADWDRLCLSQWDRHAACTKPVPVSKATCPCPMDRSYTHAGGLSLSQDRPYTHDGTCPSPTCPNLSHKVGIPGRRICVQILGDTSISEHLRE